MTFITFKKTDSSVFIMFIGHKKLIDINCWARLFYKNTILHNVNCIWSSIKIVLTVWAISTIFPSGKKVSRCCQLYEIWKIFDGEYGNTKVTCSSWIPPNPPKLHRMIKEVSLVWLILIYRLFLNDEFHWIQHYILPLFFPCVLHLFPSDREKGGLYREQWSI